MGGNQKKGGGKKVLGGTSRKKKGHAGAYLTRNQALRKLQVTLKDFRRLCILKGIYPREPKNKKKLSGADKTYFLTKDIQFLMHEPLIEEFRKFKIYKKRLNKAVHRKEYSTAQRLREHRPVYRLDHIVRERYPTFVDALRDLDDALNMIHLFATLPAVGLIRPGRVANCVRLAREFQYYVQQSQSIRKTFISIKGIYYQAEILGQRITWIVPHEFPQKLPQEVDFRIMLTFLEFYEVLMVFVNYRLFTSLGLVYPPRLKADDGIRAPSQLVADRMQQQQQEENMDVDGSGSSDEEEFGGEAPKLVDSAEARASLEAKIAELQAKRATEGSDEEEENGEDIDAHIVNEDESASEEDSEEDEEDEEEDEEDGKDGMGDFGEEEMRKGAEQAATASESREVRELKKLFAGLKFFFSREVPCAHLDFLVRSFCGETSWETCDRFPESDPSITHEVVDRPRIRDMVPGREYIQPQWVFDCVNARALLPTKSYRPGVRPPHHLSPFVNQTKQGNYIPEQALQLKRQIAEARGNPVPSVVGKKLKKEEEEVQLAEEEARMMELQAEAAGVTFSKASSSSSFGEKHLLAQEEGQEGQSEEEMDGVKALKEQLKEKKRLKAKQDARERREAYAEEKSQKQLRKALMPKKKRKLYDHIEKKKQNRQKKISRLEQKKAALDAAKEAAASGAPAVATRGGSKRNQK